MSLGDIALTSGQTAKGFLALPDRYSPSGEGLPSGILPFQGESAYNDNGVVRMKRLTFLIALVVLVVILAGSSAHVVSNTTTVESDIPDNKMTSTQTEASNSSASATITIITYAVA
jgi:hypothetical protein